MRKRRWKWFVLTSGAKKNNKNLCPAIPTSNEQWHGKTHLVLQNPYSVLKSYCKSFSIPFFSSCYIFALLVFVKIFKWCFLIISPYHSAFYLQNLPTTCIWTGPMFVIRWFENMSCEFEPEIIAVVAPRKRFCFSFKTLDLVNKTILQGLPPYRKAKKNTS